MDSGRGRRRPVRAVRRELVAEPSRGRHPGREPEAAPVRRPRRAWSVVALTLTAVLIPALVLKLRPTLGTSAPEPLAQVRFGTLAATVEGDALLVRRERVHRAPHPGEVRRLVPEGERVRVGGEVVAIAPLPGAAAGVEPDSQFGTAPAAGTGTAPAAGPGSVAGTASGSAPGTAPGTTPDADPETGPATGPGNEPRTGPATGTVSASASEYALPATASEARREYDRLAAEIHATAVALTQARDAGGETSGYQAHLDELARAQTALLPALRRDAARTGIAAAPAPPPGTTTAPGTTPPSTPAEDLPAAGLAAGEQAITTDASGVVLYQTDGLEEILTPEAVATWGPSALFTLPYPDSQATPDGPVAGGAPLFKLVDDLQVELLLLVPAESLSGPQRSALLADGVGLQVAGRDRPLPAAVLRVVEEGEHLLLHLSAPLPSVDALRLRRLRVALLLDQYEGAIVPRSAIAVEGGQTGVWVAQGSRYRFAPARVIGGHANEVAVEADLAPDAQVLLTPPPPSHRRVAN